jgi:hypothetical protein
MWQCRVLPQVWRLSGPTSLALAFARQIYFANSTVPFSTSSTSISSRLNIMASKPGMVSGGSGTAGAVNVNATAFERVLEEFKKDLKKKDKDNFQMTSLETLNQAIGEIQKQQQSERRMQNMTRLKRFIEAMAEYGKVIDTFCNGSQFVPFIWVSFLHS